ncbi:MAG: TonB-dependent receptor [Bacteroidales bacterium]
MEIIHIQLYKLIYPQQITSNIHRFSSIAVFIVVWFLFMAGIAGFTQELTQTVKGTIVDVDSRVPLPGATIVILDSDPLTGVSTDENGNFRLEHVPLGRYNLLASYIGYEPYLVRELVIGSGKEVVLNIGLKESVVGLAEVVITGMNDRKEPLNAMAIISSRQISMEEARRFAGGFDDPAHLASSYAGVSENMNSNGIVIRGNAPKGLLWRLEGLEITNPSHFTNMTSFGGGGITALSSQMLATSDFYTAAFPAEFGNALSGVFDLRLRTGNPDKREHAVQASLLGFDLSSEGPFVKGKRSTYLFNYRYSLFALLEPVLPENAGLIKYQDFSFKTDFSAGKMGIFSIWGIGSDDFSGTRVSKEPDAWEYEDDRLEGDGKTFMGALGVTHRKILGRNSMVNTSLALSGSGLRWDFQKMDTLKSLHPYQYIEDYSWKYSFSSFLNHKFSARHTNRTGITVHQLNYDLLMQEASFSGQDVVSAVDDRGAGELLQAYTQSRFDLSQKIVFNAGIHLQYFTLNNSFSAEPRLGARWRFLPGQSVSLGYGLHSRLEMLFMYLTEIRTAEGLTRPNLDLDFTRSHHLVADYDRAIDENIHFRAEVFYQYLFDVPVHPATSYSLLNVDQEWFMNRVLENKGTGENIGMDLTFERFMNRGFYYLVTASVFSSTYTGGDDIKRSSRYDKNLVLNLLAGKEWNVGRVHKNNLLGINGKFSVIGGDRISPLDETATFAAREVIYDESRAFEDRKPHVFYLLFTLNYRKNKPGFSGIWSLQVLNTLGSPEFFGYKYNHKYNRIDEDKQTIVFPNLSYKIEF